MRLNFLVLFIFSIILSSFPSAYANEKKMTCSQYLLEKNEEIERDNYFANNDVFLSTFFTLPIAFFFPPAVILPATALGFKVAAMIRVKNSHDVLAIYEEAQNGGGKKTHKLYKKIVRSHPHVSLTYEDFLNEIHRFDLNGEDCLANKYPRKRDIVSVIEL
jgi:hypothetical protein